MLRALWVYLVAGVATVLYGTDLMVSSALRLSRIERRCRVVPRRWSRTLLRAAGVTVELEGVENLGEHRAQVLVANHESWFDVFALAGHLPVEYRFVAKKELGKIPFFGPAWRACGHVSVDRADREAAIRSLDEAARQIRDEGLTVVIFPEGTRSRSGELQPFKKGAFVLAIQVGVPVIPVGIVGSRSVMPKHSWRIRPGTIRVRIGSPMEVEDLELGDRDRLMTRAREAVAELRRGEGA